MFSKRSLEGYLLVDHRDSPGIEDQIGCGGGRLFEVATYSCCGCQRGIIKNPDRSRARNYCRAHDKYMCDGCALTYKVTGVHKSYKQVMDEHEAQVTNGIG